MLSMTDVSLSPACGSPSMALAIHAKTLSPSLVHNRSAFANASLLPPCPLTKMTPAHESRADRTSSTRTCSVTFVPSERRPANPWCSPLAPYASAGATSTSSSAATSQHTVRAMIVSVSKGKCGPCCSNEPMGTSKIRVRSVACSKWLRRSSEGRFTWSRRN